MLQLSIPASVVALHFSNTCRGTSPRTCGLSKPLASREYPGFHHRQNSAGLRDPKLFGQGKSDCGWRIRTAPMSVELTAPLATDRIGNLKRHESAPAVVRQQWKRRAAESETTAPGEQAPAARYRLGVEVTADSAIRRSGRFAPNRSRVSSTGNSSALYSCAWPASRPHRSNIRSCFGANTGGFVETIRVESLE